MMISIGCTSKGVFSSGTIVAKEALIFYGYNDYAVRVTDSQILRQLEKAFGNLEFKKIDPDFSSENALMVIFFNQGEEVAKFEVDNSNIFRLNGESDTFRVSKETFDYNQLYETYLNASTFKQ